MEVLSPSSYGWIVRVAIMMGGNEILDKIVHLTTHTTRIKADATVKTHKMRYIYYQIHRRVEAKKVKVMLESLIS